MVVGTYPGTTRPKETSKCFPTKTKAQDWLRAEQVRHDQGIAVPRSKMSVGGLLTHWLENDAERRVRAVSLENYKYTLKHLLASERAGVQAQGQEVL